MHSLPLFHRITGQTVIVLGEGDAAEAKRRLIERAGGVVSNDPEAGAQLAFVALDEPEAIAAILKSRGVLVNVVDRPDLCDFTTPSLLERGDVLLAVGTGGVSAGLAKALRMRLEALLPQSLGRLATALGAARAKLRERWPDAAERRRALDAALRENGPLDPLQDPGVEAFDSWLNKGGAAKPGRFDFVLCGNNPDDLTLRQARALASADLVLFEDGVAEAILNRARADAGRLKLLPGIDASDHPGSVVILRLR